MTIADFIAKWSKTEAEERANKDSFLSELCDVLDVPRPDPKTGLTKRDAYCFERDVPLYKGDGTTVGHIDLWKEGCFILEAKQGANPSARGGKIGCGIRDKTAWHMALRDAYGQALGYARAFEQPPPFIVVCDLGYCFDLYATFDGTTLYHPFPAAGVNRLFLRDLERHRDTLRAVFLDPLSLDPAARAAKVTREVATTLARLAQALEGKFDGEVVAPFLIRCLFTMFAEDVGLLPRHIFTRALEDRWLPSPQTFPSGVETLWRVMDKGGDFGFEGRVPHFNGGLFHGAYALPLSREHLELLLSAARADWSEVEPSIFGTLIERALKPEERHQLGAHYTPRAYVERLVRPTIEEPLRAEWEAVQAEVRQILGKAKDEAGAEKQNRAAVLVVREFLKRLTQILLRISSTSVYRLVDRRAIPFLRFPRDIRFRAQDIEDYLSSLVTDPIDYSN